MTKFNTYLKRKCVILMGNEWYYSIHFDIQKKSIILEKL